MSGYYSSQTASSFCGCIHFDRVSLPQKPHRWEFKVIVKIMVEVHFINRFSLNASHLDLLKFIDIILHFHEEWVQSIQMYLFFYN